MRHNTDDPRYGLARSASAASCLGGRGGSTTADRAHHRGDRAHDRGEQQGDPDAVALGETRNHQGAQADSQRLRGLPDAHHQTASARAETTRPPVGRWPSCCWPPPCRRARETHRPRRANAPTPLRTPRRPSTPNPAPARSARRPGQRRSPTRSESRPCRSWASTTAGLPWPDRRPRSACSVGIRKAAPLMKTFEHSVAVSAMTNIDQRRTELIDAWTRHHRRTAISQC